MKSAFDTAARLPYPREALKRRRYQCYRWRPSGITRRSLRRPWVRLELACEDRMKLDTQIEARGARYPLAGTYEPEFRRVVDAFIENFDVEDEVGAACSIVLNGRTVVDVFGGWRDAAMTVPWDAPTTVCMMSVAKGITAICFNMLIDRGLVDPDAYVTEYWPEYGRNGKEKTRVRHILDHTAAVPVLTTNPLWPGA